MNSYRFENFPSYKGQMRVKIIKKVMTQGRWALGGEFKAGHK